jgi:hypothetical protein
MTKVFGIALEPILIESEKGSKYYNYIRPYKITDLPAGFKGVGLVRHFSFSSFFEIARRLIPRAWCVCSRICFCGFSLSACL